MAVPCIKDFCITIGPCLLTTPPQMVWTDGVAFAAGIGIGASSASGASGSFSYSFGRQSLCQIAVGFASNICSDEGGKTLRIHLSITWSCNCSAAPGPHPEFLIFTPFVAMQMEPDVVVDFLTELDIDFPLVAGANPISFGMSLQGINCTGSADATFTAALI